MTTKKRILAAVLILCVLSVAVPGVWVAFGIKRKLNYDNTLTINMWTSSMPSIISALEAKFPDINFVLNEYTGANNSYYQMELLQHGEGGDIFLYTTFYNDKDAPEYLVDLSGYPFLANCDRAMLSALDVNGAIYQIPGPITVRYILVNKTLFEEKGWKIPENFNEVVAVCRQIHEEAPEITPLGLGMQGMGFVWTLVTSYAQMGALDTSEGQAAEHGYRNGTASFRDGFEEGIDMVAELVDAGAFLPAKFLNSWDITPVQMCNREAAMCYVMGTNPMHTKLLSGQAKGDPSFGEYNEDEFVALPYYGRNSKNKGLILGTTNTWGINKRLEEKGNEKKLKNALRVLEYISTEEGQLAIRYDPATIPATKNLHSDDIPDFMRMLWNDSTNSIKSFFLYTGYEHMMIETGSILLEAMKKGSSEGMKEEFIRVADQLNDDFLAKKTMSSAFGYCENDLTVEETRLISCEAIRAAVNADIAIVSEAGYKNGIFNKNGLSGKLFKGDIVKETLNVIIAATSVKVVSVHLKGSEICELLETGKTMQDSNGQSASFDYWASGIEISRKKGKISKITIDGAAIKDDAVYKVAMLQQDFSKEFADSHEITNTGIGIQDALADYVAAQGVVGVR